MAIEAQYLIGDDFYTPEEYMEEVFEPTDYPGYYVSNCGRVYSLKTRTFLKERANDREGHVGFSMADRDGNRKYPYLHRLMAEAFIPNPNGYSIVRHLNDVSDDNGLENLAWGTQADNMHDAMENGHVHKFSADDREKSYEKSRRPVIAYNETEQLYFCSINDAVRALGLQQSNVWKVLNGEREHTCGWRFKYAEK